MNLVLSRSGVVLASLAPLVISAVPNSAHAEPAASAQRSTVNAAPSPLLAVDQNRSQIVARLLGDFSATLTELQTKSPELGLSTEVLRAQLLGLRADHLFAASLANNLSGVLEVIKRAKESSVSPAMALDHAKTLGDANIDLVYVPITPCRLIDTRSGQVSALGQLGGVFLPNTTRPVAPAGACGIPLSGVKNLFLSATTFNTTPNTGGYLAILPPGGAVTTVVDVFNFGSQWSSGSALVSTGSAGQVDVVVSQATADVILDVVGYFRGAILPAFGTVTSVATGSGLTGGPISTTGTINLTANQLLPTSACASGQVPKWSGSAWACAADNTGGTGTVTSLNTGAGLTGGPITAAGTINLTANQLLPTTACATNQIAKWSGSAWICAADDAGPANAFVQGGNTFSALGAGVASVLGNNDNRPLTLKVPQSTIKLLVDPANGDDGLRISYATDPGFGPTPNTINGSRANSVAAGVYGATIAGGGAANGPFFRNSVTGNFGTVGGGLANTAGFLAIVAGGGENTASGARSAIGGGAGNIASGDRAVVPGGTLNTAAGQFSFAAGFRANANHDGAFVWGDFTTADVSSTGANQFVLRANGGIRLPGAGENQPGNPAKQSGTNMFTHQIPSGGPCGTSGAFAQRTAIDHPLTNGKPDAILVITPNFGTNSVANGGGNPVFGNPVAVYYEDTGLGGCPPGKWVIYGISGAGAMLPNQKFNVLVINP